MEEPRTRDQGRRRGSPRGRAALLVLLPSAFLGVAYFLYVEIVLRQAGPFDAQTRLLLRVGGGVLVLISLVLAAACGYLLAERFLRPLRLILRLAESGDMQPERAVSLEERGREYFDLHRLLRVLVNQNKAGARAMEELDQLRAALARFREELSRTGLHGIPPEVTAAGPLREVAVHLQTKRSQLLSFFRDLRERVGRVRLELQRLDDPGGGAPADAGGVRAGPTGPSAPAAAVGAALERLRQLGTVLALESARAGNAPAPRAAELLERFHACLGELEAVLPMLSLARAGSAGPDPADPAAVPGGGELQERWRLLLEGIESVERRLEEVEER